MSMNPLAPYLDQFKGKKILVVGDVMLDVFMRGEVERISPEAPVPVVLHSSTTTHLGGAGNTARNVAALGADTMLLGIIGEDEEGRAVKTLLREARIKPYLVADPKRVTTTKTRIAARRHQLIRLDRETKHFSVKLAERRLIALLGNIPKPDMIIVSDYAKGVVTAEMIKVLKKKFGAKKILADFRPEHAPLFRHIRAITPNVHEAAALSGLRASSNASAASVVRLLADRFDTSVVLTRGDQGMTIYEQGNGGPMHIVSDAREVFDVTGAGDSVIAVLALMLACGTTLKNAARAANFVAGLVVGREGTAALGVEELRAMGQ